MRMTDINAVDLNLLGPLAALLEERHVSRAAERLRMSQPAMSRALGRLRTVLGDEVLVRGPSGYQLTPRAERIQHQLALILPRLESLFADETFDPRTAAQVFRLAGTDYSTLVLGRELLKRLFRQSPKSTVHIESWYHAVYQDLGRGVIDLAFTGAAAPPPLRSEALFEERFVCVLSPEHPLAAVDRISLAQYLGCSHVIVSILNGQQGAIDHRLEAHGTPRRASLTVSYHAAAAAALPGTMLVATLPWRLAEQLPNDGSTTAIPAPPQIEPMTYSMIWHPRLDNDPAQQWLRDTIRATAPPPLDQDAARWLAGSRRPAPPRRAA